MNQHFDKTAELVNDLAQNYVKVYQHLAEGAQKLGDGGAFENLLPPGPGQASITVHSEVKEPPRVPPVTNHEPAIEDGEIPVEGVTPIGETNTSTGESNDTEVQGVDLDKRK